MTFLHWLLLWHLSYSHNLRMHCHDQYCHVIAFYEVIPTMSPPKRISRFWREQSKYHFRLQLLGDPECQCQIWRCPFPNGWCQRRVQSWYQSSCGQKQFSQCGSWVCWPSEWAQMAGFPGDQFGTCGWQHRRRLNRRTCTLLHCSNGETLSFSMGMFDFYALIGRVSEMADFTHCPHLEPRGEAAPLCRAAGRINWTYPHTVSFLEHPQKCTKLNPLIAVSVKLKTEPHVNQCQDTIKSTSHLPAPPPPCAASSGSWTQVSPSVTHIWLQGILLRLPQLLDLQLMSFWHALGGGPQIWQEKKTTESSHWFLVDLYICFQAHGVWPSAHKF